jgi:hypothetical protein
MIEKALRKTKAVGGSLMISLPSSWCHEQAVAAGEFVRIVETHNGGLLITKANVE